jgi:hypothetical protein
MPSVTGAASCGWIEDRDDAPPAGDPVAGCHLASALCCSVASSIKLASNRIVCGYTDN